MGLQHQGIKYGLFTNACLMLSHECIDPYDSSLMMTSASDNWEALILSCLDIGPVLLFVLSFNLRSVIDIA